jgi:hypothetical protein
VYWCELTELVQPTLTLAVEVTQLDDSRAAPINMIATLGSLSQVDIRRSYIRNSSCNEGEHEAFGRASVFGLVPLRSIGQGPRVKPGQRAVRSRCNYVCIEADKRDVGSPRVADCGVGKLMVEVCEELLGRKPIRACLGQRASRANDYCCRQVRGLARLHG